MPFCTNCGAGPVPPEQKFCGQCGTRLAPAAAPAAASPLAQTSEPVATSSDERIAILRGILRGEASLTRLPDDQARRLLGALGDLPAGANVRGLAQGPPISFAQARDAVVELAVLAAHGKQEASDALIESLNSIRMLPLEPLERELLSDCLCQTVAGLVDRALETPAPRTNPAQPMTAPSSTGTSKPATAVRTPAPSPLAPAPPPQMSKKQRLAHEYARDWWAASNRGSACCDRCSGDLPRDTGCLVKHSKDANLALGADLVCYKCFADDDLPFNFRKGR